VARHIFQACPVWIYTQSNITQASYSPEYITPTKQISPITVFPIAVFPGGLLATYYRVSYCSCVSYFRYKLRIYL
jgi:hypothetical protein